MPDPLRDTSHECPSPGCVRRVPRQQFSCPQHWTTLPPELRREIRFTYGIDWAPHVRAMRAGIGWLEDHAEEVTRG